MVIICTVLAMAAPSLHGFFGSRRTADAASQIVALAHFASTQAVSEGRTYRLNLDLDKSTYWLTRQEGSAFVSSANEFGRVFRLPDGTTASWRTQPGDPGRDYVEFLPDGRSETATLRLTGRRGEIFDVTCPSPVERFSVVLGSETDL